MSPNCIFTSLKLVWNQSEVNLKPVGYNSNLAWMSRYSEANMFELGSVMTSQPTQVRPIIVSALKAAVATTSLNIRLVFVVFQA